MPAGNGAREEFMAKSSDEIERKVREDTGIVESGTDTTLDL